jgi:hypothetical protein
VLRASQIPVTQVRAGAGEPPSKHCSRAMGAI